MQRLSRRQQDTLILVERLTARDGRPPSMRELAEQMGLSIGSVHHHIARLEAKGYIERQCDTARTVTVKKPILCNVVGVDSSKLVERIRGGATVDPMR